MIYLFTAVFIAILIGGFFIEKERADIVDDNCFHRNSKYDGHEQ